MAYDSYQDTMNHKNMVKGYMDKVASDIKMRGLVHDDSKLKSPEKEIFDDATPKLAKLTYGSEEYKEQLKSMQVALDHHYQANSHHPEFHAQGIEGMNLVELTEMIADWISSSKRHSDGDIMKSIEINQNRFGYSDELKSILITTVKYLEK